MLFATQLSGWQLKLKVKAFVQVWKNVYHGLMIFLLTFALAFPSGISTRKILVHMDQHNLPSFTYSLFQHLLIQLALIKDSFGSVLLDIHSLAESIVLFIHELLSFPTLE